MNSSGLLKHKDDINATMRESDSPYASDNVLRAKYHAIKTRTWLWLILGGGTKFKAAQ